MLMWNRYSEKQAAIRDLFKMGATLAVLIWAETCCARRRPYRFAGIWTEFKGDSS